MLWRERTNSMLAVVTGPSFPYWLCPFHSRERTVVVKWDWFLHMLPPPLGFLLAVSSAVSAAWRASGRHVKEERSFQEVLSIRVLGKHFAWPPPGPQHSNQCHSCSWICCQVQNCLTKVEEMEQRGLVGFLHWEHKEVSITKYFLATFGGVLERYSLLTARVKLLMRKRSFSPSW